MEDIQMFHAREVTLLEPANFPQYNMDNKKMQYSQCCANEDIKNDETMEMQYIQCCMDENVKNDKRMEVTLLEPANFPQYNMDNKKMQYSQCRANEDIKNDETMEMQYSQCCMDENVKNDKRMEAKAPFHSTGLKEGTKKWQNDYVWIAYSMDPELYRSATTGNTVAFQEASADTERSPLDQVSPRQNTVLHLAARSGHHQLVDSILEQFPQLVMRKNYTGDLALHVAARGGHLSIVKTMVLSSSGDIKSLLNEVNNQGNTALHATLENRHEEVAKFLVRNTDPTLSYYPNKENKSPLWLATEAGYLELIRTMIDKEPIGSDSLEVEGPSVEESVDNIVSRQEQGRSNTPYESLEGKSLLHALPPPIPWCIDDFLSNDLYAMMVDGEEEDEHASFLPYPSPL